MRMPTNRAPIHPGEILLEEFLKPAGISQYRMAKDTGMSYPRINEIVKGKRPVTLDTAFRFARYLETSPGLWTNMQTAWDLWHFQKSKEFKGIQAIEPAKEMVG
jgi:addiction module HigA family antidote